MGTPGGSLAAYEDFVHLRFERPEAGCRAHHHRPARGAQRGQRAAAPRALGRLARRRRRRFGGRLGHHRCRPGVLGRRGPGHGRADDSRSCCSRRAVARRPGRGRVDGRLGEAGRLGHQRSGRGCRAGRGPPGRREHRRQLGPTVGRAYPAGRGRRRPCRHHLAVAVRGGQGQVLLAHLRLHRRAGSRAHRARHPMRTRRPGGAGGAGHRRQAGKWLGHGGAVDQAGHQPVAA